MKTNLLLKILVISQFFAITACKKNTNQIDEEINMKLYVQELNSLIYPLNGTSPNLNNDDLKPLSFLKNCKIVGLGEATHGTKEFFKLKHRIFKYLVENYNFKFFGFECDMGESIYFDRYVCNGEGDIDDLMMDKMLFWTWRTEEVKDLLMWMKTYNESKTDEEKIHYVGIDCQFIKYQPIIILDYFDKVKPEFIEEINSTLNLIEKMYNSSSVQEYYTNMSEEEKQTLIDSIDNLLIKIEDIESDLISASSYFEYQYIRQLVVNMKQVTNVQFGRYHNKSSNIRDLHMAENALWLSTLFGEHTKIAIWAHNGHVANNRYYGGTGSMGFRLKQSLKDQYQTVGFSFSKGGFTAVTQLANGDYTGLEEQIINEEPLKGSLNEIFFNAKLDNFVLKTFNIPIDSKIGNWVLEPRPFLLIGSVYRDVPQYYYRDILLKEYYDVIINYDITSASSNF